jgi:hypothetical protein
MGVLTGAADLGNSLPALGDASRLPSPAGVAAAVFDTS